MTEPLPNLRIEGRRIENRNLWLTQLLILDTRTSSASSDKRSVDKVTSI